MYAYDYSPRMLCVTFMPSETPTEAAVLCTTPRTFDPKVLNDDIQVVILAGRHRLITLRMVQGSGEARWANGLILVKCILRSMEMR